VSSLDGSPMFAIKGDSNQHNDRWSRRSSIDRVDGLSDINNAANGIGMENVNRRFHRSQGSLDKLGGWQGSSNNEGLDQICTGFSSSSDHMSPLLGRSQ
jgi:hypothetical protein